MKKPVLAGILLAVTCIRPPSVPTVQLLAPADGATVLTPVVEFAWADDGQAAWEFELATDERFRSVVRTDTVEPVEATDVRWPVDLRRDGSYWWRVRARSEGGAWGSRSAARRLGLRRFEVLSTHPTPGYAQRVAVADGRAYVADGQAGLAVFDLTGEPRFLASVMDSLNEAWGVAVRGGHAFVACGYKELMIVDVGDPDSLRIVGELEYPTPGYGYDVVLRDSFAYVAADAQFIAVNVADPAWPNLRFQYRYPRGLRGLAVEDTLCWLALEQLGVAAWNVRTLPPVRLGGIDTPSNARGVAARGGIVYVADGRGGLVVIDGSNPTAPAALASLELPGYAGQVSIGADYAYIGCGDGGLAIVDISMPAEPFIAAVVELSHVRGGVESGGRVYACDRDLGLVVIGRRDER
ncbi:MAG: hypothetical protein R6X12_07185 [bacterium]